MFGGTVGAMAMVIIILISLLGIMTALFVKSKRANTRSAHQPAIYEEIVLDSQIQRSSSSNIDMGDNKAYISTLGCQRSLN